VRSLTGPAPPSCADPAFNNAGFNAPRDPDRAPRPIRVSQFLAGRPTAMDRTSWVTFGYATRPIDDEIEAIRYVDGASVLISPAPCTTFRQHPVIVDQSIVRGWSARTIGDKQTREELGE
jgi:hypothetical protein